MAKPEVALAHREASWTVLERLPETPAFSWRFDREAVFMALGVFASISLTLLAGIEAGLALAALVGIVLYRRRESKRRAIDTDWAKAIWREFESSPSWAVEMIVLQGDAPTGEDRGVLWIQDDRLYFSGQRTSFGLAPSQIDRITTQGNVIPGVRHEIDLFLNRQTPTGPLTLSLKLLLPPDATHWERRADLQVRIQRWKNSRKEGHGQWPPTEWGPTLTPDRQLRVDWVVQLIKPVAFVYPSLLLFGKAAIAGYLFVAVFSTTIGPAQLARRRALRARQKLRRLR